MSRNYFDRKSLKQASEASGLIINLRSHAPATGATCNLSHLCRSGHERLLPDQNTFIFIVLWISALRPFPNILTDSAFGIDRLFDVLTLMVVFFFFLSHLATNTPIHYPRSLRFPIFVFILLTLLLFLAYSNSFLIHNEATGIRDIFELVRFPIMLTMLVFFAQARIGNIDLNKFIHRAFIIPFWIIVLICIIDITQVPVLSDFKHALWGQSKNTVVPEIHYYRLSGTLENPNWFSLYLNMILSLFLFFKRKSIIILLSILLCITLITLTGSVTGMIGMLFLTICYLGFVGLKPSKVPANSVIRMTFLLVFVLVGLAIVYHIDNTRLHRSLTLLQSRGVGGLASANIRISQARNMVDTYLKDPRLIGFGPSKYLLGAVIDNQYIDYLMRSGIVGLILMIMTYLYFVFVSIRFYFNTAEKVVRKYCVFVCVITLLLLIYFMAGQFGDALRLLFLYFGFITPIHILFENHKKTRLHYVD